MAVVFMECILRKCFRESAERVPLHSESEEAWTDLVALVLALDVSQPIPQGSAPWYGSRLVIAFF